MFQFLPATIFFCILKFFKVCKREKNTTINLFNDATTVTSQFAKSTLRSTEYIIDVPNIAFGPKISSECMG